MIIFDFYNKVILWIFFICHLRSNCAEAETQVIIREAAGQSVLTFQDKRIKEQMLFPQKNPNNELYAAAEKVANS